MTHDPERSYQTDPSVFMKVINRRMAVPHSLKEHQDMLYDYVQGFIDDSTGKVCYKEMASDLAAFNFDRETNDGILPKSSASISSGAYSIAGVEPKRDVFNADYIVQNSKQVPQN